MPTRISVVGDIILQVPGSEQLFEHAGPFLRASDVAIGQIEVPYTDSKDVAAITVPSPATDPSRLRGVADAGITIGTLAGNHVFDCGTQGVLDTIDHLREVDILPVGSGATLAEARRPAIVEVNGLRVGVLSYNCVGPRESWATTGKAGSAFVNVLTHYDIDDANPGNPPRTFTFGDPDSVAAMMDDVLQLAEAVDIPVVVLHKGIGHTPVTVLPYERELSRRAIDAGAKMVVGHHSHIMRGVEFYRGVPIYHGIGNFVTVTDMLTPGNAKNSEELDEWARRRRELYGFAPDPAMPQYPFHPDSRNTAIAVIDVLADGTIRAGLKPCWLDESAAPILLTADTDEGTVDYIRSITAQAGFATEFEWSDDGIVVITPTSS